MPEYLYTARNADGRKVTERLEALSADSVMQMLHDRGYSEIILHTDDVSALYTRQSEVDEHISPREYIALRRFKGFHPAHIFFMLRKIYLNSWKTYVVILALFGLRCSVRLPWGPFDYLLLWIVLVMLALPVAWVLISQIFNPARRYRELIEARSWGRWEEVLQLLPGVGDCLRPEEGAFREAQALAGLGRLDEALEKVKPFADGLRMPQWLYWARLSEVYSAAGDRQQVVAVGEKAAELAPENSTVLLDLASALLRYRHDARRAKIMLDRAKSHALSDISAVFLKVVEGMLALEEGDALEAKQHLEQALAELRLFRSASPLMGVIIARTDAYLAIAYAAFGDTASAVRHFRRAEPRLQALRADDLLSRCEQAIGIHSPE